MVNMYQKIQERRAEERRYEMDAMYEVWRAGGNIDRIDYERVDEHYQNGDSAEDAARHELRAQRPKPQEQEQEEQQEVFYEQRRMHQPQKYGSR